MKKTYLLSFLFSFFIIANSYSQNNIYNLLFNSNTNVVRADFFGGPPVISYTGIATTGFVAEGIAHWEDGAGNLTFWVTSNGVYDHTGALMPGSIGILANSSSAEIDIAPFPNNPNRFYILYNAETCSSLYYSVVDMTLNGGNGDVVNLNTLIDNNSFSEGLELIRIPCSNNMWFVTFQCYTGFKRFLIDNTGISGGTIIYPYTNPGTFDGRAQLDYYKGKIAMGFSWSQDVFTANFNPVTGTISNPLTLSDPQFYPGGSPYGVAFSPDTTKLYFPLWYQNSGNNLFRWDFTTSTLSSYALTSGTNGFGQIKIGHDGKLYIINDGGMQITCIDNPNDPVPTFSTIPITSTTSLGMSDFIKSDVFNTGMVSIATTCAGTSVVLTASGATTYTWSPGTGLSATTGATVTASPTVTTTYTVTGTDVNGCAGTASVTVTVGGGVTVQVVPASASICMGANVSFTASGANTYAWSPATGLSATTGATVIASPTSTTTYTVTGTDAGGCQGIDSVTVTVNNTVNVTVNPANPAICIGQSTTLTASGAVNYTWSPATGLSAATGASVTANPTTTTTYTVSGTDAIGCAGTVAVTVSVSPTVNVAASIVGPSTICVGDNTQITAVGSNGDGGPYTYTWDNGIGVAVPPITVSPIVNTTYIVTVTDGCGSTATDDVTISVFDVPVINFTADNLQGCSPLIVNFTDNTVPVSTSYTWNFHDPSSGSSNTSNSQSPTHIFSSAGVYDITLTVSNSGCTSSLTVPQMITVHPTPVAAFSCTPHMSSIFDNTTYHFYDESLNASIWNWNFGDAGSDQNTSNEQNPSHVFENVGSYSIWLVVSNEFGCKDSASDVIVIKPDYTFYVPNAFTPDDDGLNDGFIPTGLGIDISSFTMYIFNRWGEQIYKTSDLTRPWNGKDEKTNKKAPIDVYVWLIYIADKTGKTHRYMGHVDLIR